MTQETGAEAGMTVVDMTATGTPGASYRLEASATLAPGSWSTLHTVTADGVTGSVVFHVAQSPGAFPKRFFRISSP